MRKDTKLLKKYFFDKMIYRVLKKEGINYREVERAIDSLDYSYIKLVPRSCVVGVDTTYLGSDLGITIFRDVTNKVTLHWIFVRKENLATYVNGINYLKQSGIHILGFVVDGFWPFYLHYQDKYPIQMCQKHMKDIVRRYITLHPNLEAGKELKQIVSPLTKYTAKEFDLKFDAWVSKWRSFLGQRTYNDDGTWNYTHDRLRSAMKSLRRYRPFLFTYKSCTWIPNTNNSLEGFNSALKSFIKPHHGLIPSRRAKLAHLYLKNSSVFNWAN